MVTSEFRMPALELSEATLLSLWISDMIDLQDVKRFLLRWMHKIKVLYSLCCKFSQKTQSYSWSISLLFYSKPGLGKEIKQTKRWWLSILLKSTCIQRQSFRSHTWSLHRHVWNAPLPVATPLGQRWAPDTPSAAGWRLDSADTRPSQTDESPTDWPAHVYMQAGKQARTHAQTYVRMHTRTQTNTQTHTESEVLYDRFVYLSMQPVITHLVSSINESLRETENNNEASRDYRIYS